MDTALAVTYPRGLEWLALVRGDMVPIDKDGAVAALDAVFAAIDGTPAGDLTPDIRCGPAGADMAAMFPATGQTSCWDSFGGSIACAGTGHDGDLQAGAPLSYTDNGDGTITDNNTGLMWEKLCDEDPPGPTCPTVHDVDTTYPWADMVAVKIAALNTPPCFAGHCDWRGPNVKELPSIVNYENVSPAVSPEFNNNCVAPCSVTTCSCTASAYWSSTSTAFLPFNAWHVGFPVGNVNFVDKGNPLRVRAVRGGW